MITSFRISVLLNQEAVGGVAAADFRDVTFAAILSAHPSRGAQILRSSILSPERPDPPPSDTVIVT
jgi:hypothetical protein